MPPLPARAATDPSTVRTPRTPGVKCAEAAASSSSVRSANSTPRASAARTQAPEISWASRNGTPRLTSHSAMSVARENPWGANSASLR